MDRTIVTAPRRQAAITNGANSNREPFAMMLRRIWRSFGFMRFWRQTMNVQWLGRVLRGVRAGERYSVSNRPVLNGVPDMITLQSTWFDNGKPMPRRSAGIGVGDNISPPLNWSGAPTETVEFAIVMEDPDVPLPLPFVHLIAYGIAPDCSSLAEGALAFGAADVVFGRSTAGGQGYMGPRPVPGHGPHSCIFYVLALNRRASFASPPKLTVFLQSIAGAVVGYGRLVGTYERN
jgi:phosphatidylethanolamine-binding protein (PEBP) family uncharacterized protein